MYEDFFGLTEEPFKMSPSPRYFFLSKRHQEALAYIQYGIEKRKGFMAITGEVGAGKTTVCRHLMSTLEDHIKVALVVNPCLSDRQMLETIIEDFGISGKMSTKKHCFDAINRFLLEQKQKNNEVVLIIDEAQNLTMKVLEQIRLLSNLETEDEKLLQIIFIAQPEFRETLQQKKLLQLKQRISLRYHLSPMNLDEIRDYILHRLSVAGGSNETIILTPKALGLIYQYTKGVPRVINLLMDKVLMASFLSNTRHVSFPLVKQAIYEAEGLELDSETLESILGESLIPEEKLQGDRDRDLTSLLNNIVSRGDS